MDAEKTIARYVEVEYDEPIYQQRPVTPPGTGFYSVQIGKRRMKCKVAITIDLEGIAREMGRRAATSKGGKAQDGHVTVKRNGTPTEVSREMIR